MIDVLEIDLDKPSPLSLHGNGRAATVTEAISFQLSKLMEPIVVPVGFITDGTSVPKWAWWFEPPFGEVALAAVFHDYLYRLKYVPKAVADAIFFVLMKRLGVHKTKAHIIFLAVMHFGHSAYYKKAKEKKDERISGDLSERSGGDPDGRIFHVKGSESPDVDSAKAETDSKGS